MKGKNKRSTKALFIAFWILVSSGISNASDTQCLINESSISNVLKILLDKKPTTQDSK